MVSLIMTMAATMMRAPLVQRHNHHHQSPRHAPPRARVVARRRDEPQKVTRPLLQSDLLLGGVQHLLSHRRSAQEVRRNQRNRAARARGQQRSHQRGEQSRPESGALLRIGLSAVISRSHPHPVRNERSVPPCYSRVGRSVRLWRHVANPA